MSKSVRTGLILIIVSILIIMTISFLSLSPKKIMTLSGTRINLSNLSEITDTTYIPANSILIKIKNSSPSDRIDIFLDHKIEIERKESKNSETEVIRSEKNYTSLTGCQNESLTFIQEKYEVRFTSVNSNFTITVFNIYNDSEKITRIKAIFLISIVISCIATFLYIKITKKDTN